MACAWGLCNYSEQSEKLTIWTILIVESRVILLHIMKSKLWGFGEYCYVFLKSKVKILDLCLIYADKFGGGAAAAAKYSKDDGFEFRNILRA